MFIPYIKKARTVRGTKRPHLFDTKVFLASSKRGFERVLTGPSPEFMLGPMMHRSFEGFTSGFNQKKFTTTPFKIIGLKY